MIELALCYRTCELWSVRTLGRKRTLASNSGVIAAHYSIIADAVESSFIANGTCNAPCEPRRRGGRGPNLAEASQSIHSVQQPNCGQFHAAGWLRRWLWMAGVMAAWSPRGLEGLRSMLTRIVEALRWRQKSRVSAAANPPRTKVPEFMTHTNGYNARSAAKQRVTQQYVRREGHEGRCN